MDLQVYIYKLLLFSSGTPEVVTASIPRNISATPVPIRLSNSLLLLSARVFLYEVYAAAAAAASVLRPSGYSSTYASLSLINIPFSPVRDRHAFVYINARINVAHVKTAR